MGKDGGGRAMIVQIDNLLNGRLLKTQSGIIVRLLVSSGAGIPIASGHLRRNPPIKGNTRFRVEMRRNYTR